MPTGVRDSAPPPMAKVGNFRLPTHSTISVPRPLTVLTRPAFCSRNPARLQSPHAERLPWHVKLDQGTAQVEDEGRGSLDLSPFAVDWSPLVGGFVE